MKMFAVRVGSMGKLEVIGQIEGIGEGEHTHPMPVFLPRKACGVIAIEGESAGGTTGLVWSREAVRALGARANVSVRTRHDLRLEAVVEVEVG